ncbi:MAG TPA: tetratricopeptide repeat protein [Polyangiaceae bacterium]
MLRFGPAWALSAVLSLSACGSSQKPATLPALAPAKPEAVKSLAQGVQVAREAKGRERAISLFERAVQVDGELWEARYNLGVLRAEAGDLARAEQELARAQALAPNAEDVALALSEVRRRRKDPAGAIEALESFVQRHPDAARASIALIAALREGGKLDAAIELSHRVLVRRSRDARALSELALSHLARGEVDTAKILIEEAAKAGPSAVTERAAGLIALEQGDDALAFKHFSRATELDPNDTTARLNIGTVLLQAGVYDRAVSHFAAVQQAEPDNLPAALGLAAARRGQAKRDDKAAYAEVEKVLARVLEEEPENLAATYNLAVLYAEHAKRPQEATALFEKFLRAAPKSHPARPEAERWLSSRKK